MQVVRASLLSFTRRRLFGVRAPWLRAGLVALPLLAACDDGCGNGCRARGGPSATTRPSFQPFDDFSAGRIDETRWELTDSLRGFTDPLAAPHALELVREVEQGALRLSTKLGGETGSDLGTSVAHVRLAARRPETIVALEATLRVSAVEAVGCDANPAFAFARATVGGMFFNSGAPEKDSTQGDVLAVVGVGRRSDSPDPPDVLRALAVVLHCANPCYAFAEHVPPSRDPSEVLTMQDLGPVTLGQAIRLGVGWDEPGNRFLFWRDGAQVHELRYALADQSAPSTVRRHLDVAEFVPRCANAPALASIDVSFDDVAVCATTGGECRFGEPPARP